MRGAIVPEGTGPGGATAQRPSRGWQGPGIPEERLHSQACVLCCLAVRRGRAQASNHRPEFPLEQNNYHLRRQPELAESRAEVS